MNSLSSATDLILNCADVAISYLLNNIVNLNNAMLRYLEHKKSTHGKYIEDVFLMRHLGLLESDFFHCSTLKLELGGLQYLG